MREIKFRAWDTKKKEMFYEEHGTWFYDSEGCFPDEIIKVTHNNHGWEWMQYTGLKDKNGKEVYEGDVVRANLYRGNIIYEVEWKSINNHTSFGAGTHNIEVIGNIYENPELLK